jgi:hypothetical protein
MSCRSMETPASVGKCGSAFVEGLQVGPHGCSDPIGRGELVVEALLEAMQNFIQPARLDGDRGAGVLRVRQARPFGVRVAFLPQKLSVCSGRILMSPQRAARRHQFSLRQSEHLNQRSAHQPAPVTGSSWTPPQPMLLCEFLRPPPSRSARPDPRGDACSG